MARIEPIGGHRQCGYHYDQHQVPQVKTHQLYGSAFWVASGRGTMAWMRSSYFFSISGGTLLSLKPGGISGIIPPFSRAWRGLAKLGASTIFLSLAKYSSQS